jgi:signal transduction histidine kinase
VRVRTTGPYVVLAVGDAGPGMSPELLATAPGRFTRSPDARSRPGSGLGLSLVAELAATAGGQLRLCHAGHHVSHGPDLPVECRHGAEMTVSVILPRGG